MSNSAAGWKIRVPLLQRGILKCSLLVVIKPLTFLIFWYVLTVYIWASWYTNLIYASRNSCEPWTLKMQLELLVLPYLLVKERSLGIPFSLLRQFFLAYAFNKDLPILVFSKHIGLEPSSFSANMGRKCVGVRQKLNICESFSQQYQISLLLSHPQY